MSLAATPQTLTFLFTDIEGSTPLWDRNADAMRDATERHNALLRQAIAAHGGDTFQVVGDAFCVAFADANAAVRAAVDAQRALTSEAWGAAPIRVRMGLHSGAAEAAGEEIFRGPTLARAARVMAAAHGEQILLAASTVALLDSKTPAGALLRDLGDHTLRGFARAERLYQLVVPGLRVAFPPIATREALRTNLPPSLTSFVGRERALADIRKHTREARMVTLVGAGGTGKTRLMLEAAAELMDTFPDGVWLVELATLTDATQIAQTIAATLNARAEGDVPALSVVDSTLAGKQSLLLLDNCEHVIDEAALVAQSLLRALPALHILATSREALRIEGELAYRVPSLALPAADARSNDDLRRSEAVRLFIDRAKAVVPEFDLTADNADAIAQVCRRLDGIPLALELAAARLTALSVDELAQRLSDRFRLLTGGRRTALPRQRTLRALVDWSYELLSADERSVLMTLSVFAGGFTLAAAEAVYSDNDQRETSVLDAIERLIAKSLLTAEHDQGSQTRYRLLETIRQYAAEKLVEAGLADAARRRHFDYFAALAERAKPELRKALVLEWLDRLEGEHDNLRAALDWTADAAPQGYARLAGALYEFWDIRGHFAEGFGHLQRALEVHIAEDSEHLQALLGCAALAHRLDHWHRADTLLQTTVTLAQRLSDTRCEAEATLLRAYGFGVQPPDVLESLAERGRALSQSIDDAWGVGLSSWIFGRVAMIRGSPADAQRFFIESIERFDRGGCVLMAALARTWAGRCASERLDFTVGRSLLEDALAAHRRFGNVHDAATTLCALGRLDLNVGHLDDALDASQQSADIFRALHDRNCGSHSALVIAEVLYAKGDHPRAIGLAEESVAIEATLGFHHFDPWALWLVGRCHEAQGNPDAARNAYFEGLHAVVKANQVTNLPCLFEAIAGMHPDASIAPALLGFATALREARYAPPMPSERADVERWTKAVRAARRDAFERDFAVGRSMGKDDAIARALALETPATGTP